MGISGYTLKMDPISIYLHIPFCQHRCGYCDFNTYAGIQELIPAYVDALIEEIKVFTRNSPEKKKAHTIFFGGGTPSLLTSFQIERILNTLNKEFAITKNVEISLEANPGTVNQEYLMELYSLGVNRLSMGVQSTIAHELKLLERNHGYRDAVNAVEFARKAHFDNISLDLIFGLPNQKLSDWKKNLINAFDLGPDHISLYALTIEQGTPLKKQIDKGMFPYPNDDQAADMYEWTMDFLAEKGFSHYEISNWAKSNTLGKSFQAKHNLQYWKNYPYIGFGAGAHSFMGGHRFSNILFPAKYIQKMKEKDMVKFPIAPTSIDVQEISKEIEMQETMMMGLRLLQQGVSSSEFFIRFGVELEKVFKTEIEGLIKNGLLRWQGDVNENLILTRRGRLLGNQVFMNFV